jgi:hypothetical protein
MGRKDSIAGWLAQMHDHYLTGDYTGALGFAELILAEEPDHPVAGRHAARCRSVQRVARQMTGAELRWVTLDGEAEQLVALAEVAPSVEEWLERSGLPRLQALKRLSQLIEQRVLVLRPSK